MISLSDIEFPVFEISGIDLERRDGVLFLDGKVLDDGNVSGKTLGERRLKTPIRPLYRITKMVPDYRNMFMRKGSMYIDNLGRVFNYRKQKKQKLSYYKIGKIYQRNGKTFVRLQGIQHPFRVERAPGPEYKYAGIVHDGVFPWLLFEFATEWQPDRNVKV